MTDPLNIKPTDQTTPLRALIHHCELAHDLEKRALARELHDEVGAMLTSLSIHLQSAYTLFPLDEKGSQRKEKIQAIFAQLVATTRRMEAGLYPPMLELFGLKAAIAEFATDWEKHSGIGCKVSLPDEELPVDANNTQRDIALYRMLEMLLANILEHANASQADVILDIDEDQLFLTVRDNGVGINLIDLPDTKGCSLKIMRERLAVMGGELMIDNHTSSGACITISLSLIAT